MKTIHGHLSGHGTQTVDQLAFDHLTQLLDVKGAITQRLRGARDALFSRHHRDVEFDTHVDTHPVFGDKRGLTAALHLKAQSLHVDRADFVQQRYDDDAAIHNDLFATRAGFHQADLARGASIKAAKYKAYEQEYG